MAEISKEEFKKMQRQIDTLLRLVSNQNRKILVLEQQITRLKHVNRQQTIDIANLSRK